MASMAGDMMLNGPQLGSAASASLGNPASAAGGLDGGLMLDHIDGEQRIVDNFCALFNESRQLFNGLR